jgi:hypothetical protein
MSGSLLSGHEVRLRVVDESKEPIAGVQTLIAFTTVVSGGAIKCEGLTDQHGIFSGSGRGEGPVLVRANKEGYYGAAFQKLTNDQNLDLDLTLILRKIIDPTPLHALRLDLHSGGSAPKLSIQNEWLDYDLAAGDWVKPRGKGEVADIRFKFRNEFKGWQMDDEKMAKTRAHHTSRNLSEDELRNFYGKFDGELEISFPGEKEGLVEERARFLPYSQLTMPHEAPLEGYAPTRRYAANTYALRSARENVGFFLRTRVKLDQNGKIISANYAKVTGDFQFDARGVVGLIYYFNPVPNDRNLEFDPKKNLFPSSHPGANVNDP